MKPDVPTIVTYMLKLQPDYLTELLLLFDLQMSDCLRVPFSREMYARYVALLKKVRKVPGVNDLIDRMLEKTHSIPPSPCHVGGIQEGVVECTMVIGKRCRLDESKSILLFLGGATDLLKL